MISFGLGLLRGRMDKLSVVDGSPWVSWGTASVVILIVNVVAKLGLDGVGRARRRHHAALSSSILLSLGLTLLGEAAVVWLRSGRHPRPTSHQSGRTGTVGTCTASGRPTSRPSVR